MKNVEQIQEKIKGVEAKIDAYIETGLHNKEIVEAIPWYIIVRNALRWTISDEDRVEEDEYNKKIKGLLALRALFKDIEQGKSLFDHIL